jgi:hypothetical protein
MKPKSIILIVLSVFISGLLFFMSSDLFLQEIKTKSSSSELAFNPIFIEKFMFPVENLDAHGCEIIDMWTADPNGKRDTTFNVGDVIEFMIFLDPEGWNCLRSDAFYHCGETNPRKWLYTCTTDLGKLPPLPPNYGWITGIGCYAPNKPGRYDWAARIKTSAGQCIGGIPLSGKPPCFRID